MKKIGLFYAAKAEKTSWVAERIQKEFGESHIKVVPIEQAWQNDFAAYDCFIAVSYTHLTSIEKIMDTVERHLEEYPECKVYLSTPPVIPGLGTSGGFEMQLEARGEATFDNLVDAADTLMYYASKNKALTGLSSSLRCV